MRILIIGGSSFVGRAITRHAIDRGHDVTLFNRGQTDPGAFPEAEQLVGDRNDDMSALEGRSWDATVDVCAYVPKQVRSLLQTLGDGAGHYTFISTVSVYGEVPIGFGEDSALLDPSYDDELTMDKYGALKVGCEKVAREIAGDRLLVIRPGFVIGPHDPTHRFTYWVERVADGRSPMAGPDREQPLQTVDASDLGRFTVEQTEALTSDTFHIVAPDPAPTFGVVLQSIAEALSVQLPDVKWLGARPPLPLTMPESYYPKETASLAKARAAGFTHRPLADSVRDIYDWVSKARADGNYAARPGVGPTEAEEAELLSQ